MVNEDYPELHFVEMSVTKHALAPEFLATECEICPTSRSKVASARIQTISVYRIFVQ